MVFSSAIFLFVFFLIFFGVHYLLPRRPRNVWILLCSLLFIAWGSMESLYTMLASITINYLGGMMLHFSGDRRGWRRASLVLSVFLNLALLFYYKYFNFFMTTVNSALGTDYAWQTVILPIGISFFTFQGMSYVIDVYRKEAAVQKNPVYLALYVSMFPQLIAGPIVRYTDIEANIHQRTITLDDVFSGLKRFIAGLAKKVLLANTMGEVSANIMAAVGTIDVPTAWLGALCYMMQIYLDFSAYSDMAIGLGKMMGFRFMENFNLPYISKSVTEFWRRWHISLSSWFRDYLYIPLGGNRTGNVYVNLFIVFLCTGVWHGASWNFIVWGMWNGLFLIIERLLRKNKKKDQNGGSVLKKALGWAYTMVVVYLGWVLFNATDMTQALNNLRCMFGLDQPDFVGFSAGYFCNTYHTFILLVSILVSLGLPQKLYKRLTSNGKVYSVCQYGIEPLCLLALLVLSIVWIINGTYNPFIYFQF